MERDDQFGILGTPLLSEPSSAFKLSLQNRIAPTPVVYAKLRQNAAFRKERRLLDDPVQLSSRDDSLYVQNTRPSRFEDIADDEDRAYLRLKGRISKTRCVSRCDNEVRPASSYGYLSSFLLATVDFPEICSKQARTPLGYREIHNIYSLRRDETSQIHTKTRSHSDSDGFLATSLAPRKNENSGLGYGDKGATNGSRGDIKSKATTNTFGFTDGLESATGGAGIGHESDEEDYANHLANSGYKNLDAAEEVMSRKLKEGHIALTMRGSRKRTLTGTGEAEGGSVTFSAFTPWRAPDKQDTKWTEYVVPPGFAAHPSHDYEKDHMKTPMNVLPPPLQEEYRKLLRVYKETMSEEANFLKRSIAKATEEQEARLHRIRGFILEDMGNRFTGPQAAQKARILTRLQPHTEDHAQYTGCSNKHLNQGEVNRTIQHWKPENLLCRRLGVEEPKKRARSTSEEEKAPLHKFPRAQSADEFQIHSITDNKGSKTGTSSDSSLLQGEIVHTEGKYDEEVRVKDDRIRPSRDLIETIFVNPPIEDKEELIRDESTSNRVSTETLRRTQRGTRGIHKTRAVDFF